MKVFRQTLKSTFILSGVTLHSGKHSSVTVGPGQPGKGIQFKRLDAPGVITASWKNASDIVLSTKIWSDDRRVSVSTIEHFMSAFSALGVDDAYLEVSCDELPILDGSCLDIVTNILEVGLVDTHIPRHYIEVLRKVEVNMGDKMTRLEPNRNFVVNFGIDFPNPHIGVSIFQETITPKSFTDIAHARTFIMAENLESSRSMGKMLGASTETMIIVSQDGIQNQGGLRMQNEFACHKALDAIGDLYLAEAPIIGKFTAWKAGHLLNNMALVALMSDTNAWRYVTANREPIVHKLKRRVGQNFTQRIISRRPSRCSTNAVQFSTQSPSFRYWTPLTIRIWGLWMCPQTTPPSPILEAFQARASSNLSMALTAPLTCCLSHEDKDQYGNPRSLRAPLNQRFNSSANV